MQAVVEQKQPGGRQTHSRWQRGRRPLRYKRKQQQRLLPRKQKAGVDVGVAVVVVEVAAAAQALQPPPLGGS